MEIPINAKVKCTDGVCGRSTSVIVNPANRQITHVVVKLADWPHTERLVPIELVRNSGDNTLELDCTGSHLITLKHFVDTHYVREMHSNPISPGAPPISMLVPQEYYRIPEGELALQRGAHVEATDGAIGRVDEFVIDPATDRITHLIVHEGHLWGQHNVPIPVAAIDRIEANVVHLKLDKRALKELLPTTVPQAVDERSHHQP
jgi:sporulation protein YlmC with PRC-barrel domain